MTMNWEQALEEILKACENACTHVTLESIMSGVENHERRGRALHCLLMLHKILTGFIDIVYTLEDLIPVGQPGQILIREIEEKKKRLDELRKALPEHIKNVQEITQLEKELQEEEKKLDKTLKEERAVHERVRQQKARLEEKKKEIEKLRVLTEHPDVIKTLEEDIHALEQALPPGSENVQILLDTLKQLLSSKLDRLATYQNMLPHDIQQTLAKLEELEKKCQILANELEEKKKQYEEARVKYEQLRNELEEWVHRLKRYVEADKMIASVLPGAKGPSDLICEAEQLILQAEDVLRKLLISHEKEMRNQPIGVV